MIATSLHCRQTVARQALRRRYPTDMSTVLSKRFTQTQPTTWTDGPMPIPRTFTFLGITSLLWCLFLIVSMDAAQREVLSLGGTWQIAEGSLEEIPTTFDHSVPVPGLVDMATPAFAEVGVLGSKLREAFWYKRTFQVDKPISAVAQLKVHNALFGIKIILNGVNLGDYPETFTPHCKEVFPQDIYGLKSLINCSDMRLKIYE